MSQTSALVIDTSPFMRNYVREILCQELAFDEVHEAQDAGDALLTIQSGCGINWIFSSWEMPGLSTHDLLEAIRNCPGDRQPHFVLMSSNEEHVVRNIAIREGVADFLCKPFSPNQMVHMVHRLNGLVERRGAERVKVRMPCEIDMGFDSFHHYGAELVDISKNGCRVKTSQVKPGSGYIGDYATVTLFPAPETQVQVHAKIRRLEFDPSCGDPLRDTEIAVEFVNVTPGLNEKLAELVNTAKQQSATSC